MKKTTLRLELDESIHGGWSLYLASDEESVRVCELHATSRWSAQQEVADVLSEVMAKLRPDEPVYSPDGF